MLFPPGGKAPVGNPVLRDLVPGNLGMLAVGQVLSQATAQAIDHYPDADWYRSLGITPSASFDRAA